MSFLYRAAALAAAAIVLAGSMAFADPLMAWEAELASSATSVPTITVESPFPLPLQGETPPPAKSEGNPTPSDQPSPAAAEETKPESEPLSLSKLVDLHMSGAVFDKEHHCLASAVYFEAKGEPLEGQLAVAEVVINRSQSGRFPQSICGVVKQRGQFSFVRRGHIPAVNVSSLAWRKAVAIAHIARQDLADSKVPTAMFFHARYVSPGWRGLKRLSSLGNHIFYR